MKATVIEMIEKIEEKEAALDKALEAVIKEETIGVEKTLIAIVVDWIGWWLFTEEHTHLFLVELEDYTLLFTDNLRLKLLNTKCTAIITIEYTSGFSHINYTR